MDLPRKLSDFRKCAPIGKTSRILSIQVDNYSTFLAAKLKNLLGKCPPKFTGY